ncbi:monovalent cation:proton antiporter-2 (CPA2) family protein [Celeribacter halophilus]|uniref:Monovalent cation:proton antiporter-2 (CPA2) family protein n=1 Tax=Celeribacter halophilus TaxID=576117 RepID=A0AAW7XUU5_9RHOB|nr:monovalent cation:proton antiporter-2 (CPA2) family protein [Celeribacter halophilus]MDO6456759.1 monovalent cation:proton antiporter-2 (CPA2) family protein [Celeribacter halophilus]MDO6723222.1 monovalent cation:proton antiporter-2 (CPA2) family protein [Celeribacter halophilus]
MQGLLAQAVIYLAAMVVAVPLARRLGLGSVLGYLIAGMVIGPVLGLVQHNESEDLLHFAEFGVVMMLFLIGLELDPRGLWEMRHKLLGMGGLQVLVTTSVIAGAAVWFGQSWQTGLALGMILSLSSTAVVLQTLSEKNLIHTGGGRAAFSVLLTQDIAVIPMLALMPLLATGSRLSINPDGSISRATDAAHAADHDASLVAGLPGWGVTLVTLGAVAAIILAGVFLTRPVFRYIHSANLREIYTAVALLIVIGIALLMTAVGLSPALGTFLAGVVLANSEFRHELESSIEPFKGLLLGLFFIAVGAGVNFTVLFRDPVTIIGLTVMLMLTKGLILYGIGRVFKLRTRGQWLFTLSLAQAGEFGMVLTTFSLQQGVLAPYMGERVLLIIALSLLFTPLFFILQDYLRAKLSERSEEAPADDIDDQQEIIIAGIGRFGQVVNRLVQASGFHTTVLDNNLKTIQLMRKFGFKGFFGDPTRPELLHAAGIDTARVLVITLDDPKAATQLVRYARSIRPDLFIIVRARDRIHVYELFKAGADKIVRELFDSSLRAGRYVLEEMGFSEYDAAVTEQAYFQHDREALRSLAELWDPNTPVSENAEYVARSQALDKAFEAALLTELERKRQENDAA